MAFELGDMVLYHSREDKDLAAIVEEVRGPTETDGVTYLVEVLVPRGHTWGWAVEGEGVGQVSQRPEPYQYIPPSGAESRGHGK